jgi:type II secretory pathway component GspD/PulD (secretin)
LIAVFLFCLLPVAWFISSGQENSPSPVTGETAAVEMPQAVDEAVPVEPGKAEDTADEAPEEAAPAEGGTEAVESDLIEIETDKGLPAGAAVTETRAGSTDLISISLDNVPLQDVVRMFTRISGANIVAGTNLVGNVTVSLQDVEWRPALNVILDSVQLALIEKSPGIYTIMSKSELATEPVTVDTIYLKYTTSSNILPVIQRLLISTNASVSSFPAANAVVVQETSARLTLIKDVVERMDRPRPQVFIEAKFVELNDQAIKDLGVNWEVLKDYRIAISQPTYSYSRGKLTTKRDQDTYDRIITDRLLDSDTTTRRNISQDTEGENNEVFQEIDATVPNPPTITYGSDYLEYDTEVDQDTYDRYRVNLDSHDDITVSAKSNLKDILRETEQLFSAVLTADDFALTLSALKQNDGVEIVSNPRVIVASGETAKIHVGRNEPNIEATLKETTGTGGEGAGGGNQYVYGLNDEQPYIEIGVKVEVTPTVNTESNIAVKIVPELSRKLGDKVAGDAAISFPITQIRKIITEFSLESGRTVAIGGLTSTEDKETVRKIPLLGDIPIIGKYLFSHSHTEKLQDEVIIFVTVGLASPSTLTTSTGIPSGGRLIHRQLAREAARGETK